MQKDGSWRARRVLELPARTVCVAAGTSPNIIYEKEHPGTFELDDESEYFRGHTLATPTAS